MYINKSDCKDIIRFLEIYKHNYDDILTSEFISFDNDCIKKIKVEIAKIDILIKKLT